MSKPTVAAAFLKRITTHDKLPFFISGIVGMLFCISLYGLQILNPLNTGWLYANGDISQHQIGWDFFRRDSWRLPLGGINNLAYPEGTSLVYMDSIPIVAVIAKTFSSILPEQFQYFGLWGLVSFFLQGMIAAIVLARFSKNKTHIVLGSILAVLLPVFIMRTYAHTALASQWVILLGVMLVVYRHRLNSLPKSIAAWSSLLSLSVAIHPYFLPMNGIILLAYLILRKASIKESLLHIVISGLGAISIFWLIGGFVTKDVGTATLGMFGADLNALVNPITFSYFISGLPTTAGAYEGLAYMGLGIYVLIVILIAHYILSIRSFSGVYRTIRQFALRSKDYIAVVALVIGSVLLAVGPVWYFNGSQVAVFELPDLMARGLSIFRSTGRFVWIASYAISIFVIVWLLRRADSKKVSSLGVTLLLVIVVGIQYVDVLRSDGVKQKVTTIATRLQSNNRFDNQEVRSLLSGKKHVAYVRNTLHGDDFFELGPVVARAELTINDGYISRKPVAAVNRETSGALRELTTGSLREDTVYVTNDQNDIIAVQNSPRHRVIRVDNTWLIGKF